MISPAQSRLRKPSHGTLRMPPTCSQGVTELLTARLGDAALDQCPGDTDIEQKELRVRDSTRRSWRLRYGSTKVRDALCHHARAS